MHIPFVYWLWFFLVTTSASNPNDIYCWGIADKYDQYRGFLLETR